LGDFQISGAFNESSLDLMFLLNLVLALNRLCVVVKMNVLKRFDGGQLHWERVLFLVANKDAEECFHTKKPLFPVSVFYLRNFLPLRHPAFPFAILWSLPGSGGLHLELQLEIELDSHGSSSGDCRLPGTSNPLLCHLLPDCAHHAIREFFNYKLKLNDTYNRLDRSCSPMTLPFWCTEAMSYEF
jgi:hypothetical protein